VEKRIALMKEKAEVYNDFKPGYISGYMDKDIRIAPTEKLAAISQKLIAQLDEGVASGELSPIQKKWLDGYVRDNGYLATTLGYDGFTTNRYDAERLPGVTFLVILDRSKLTVAPGDAR
jgi:hypothetical protein